MKIAAKSPKVTANYAGRPRQNKMTVVEDAATREDAGSRDGFASVAGLESNVTWTGLTSTAKTSLPRGRGVVMPDTINDARLCQCLVDTMVGQTSERLSQTIEFLKSPIDALPKELRNCTETGSLVALSGPKESTSRYLPGEKSGRDRAVANDALALLGTKHCDIVKDSLRELFLVADALCPELQKSDRRGKSNSELSRGPNLATVLMDFGLPNDREPVRRPTQSDVSELAYSLAGNPSFSFPTTVVNGETLFSADRVRAESANLLSELIPRMKTPEMHQLLADAGLLLLKYPDTLEPQDRASLIHALKMPGGDPQMSTQVAIQLLPQGDMSGLPMVVSALSHPNSDLRDSALNALQAVSAASSGRPLIGADGLVEALHDNSAREQALKSLKGASAELESLAESEFPWVASKAASILVDLKTS